MAKKKKINKTIKRKSKPLNNYNKLQTNILRIMIMTILAINNNR